MIESLRPNRWLSFGEILVIFALFALQGSWPVPDVNEAHYLGKAAHYWNPGWVEGDFFLDSADSHKVFYFTFGWLTLWLPLPAVAWTGRLITWLLLAWAWRRFSVALLPRPGWSILSAALFVMLNERFQMAGEWFIGGVEAKSFAFVPMLFGLEAMVTNRWNRAWLWLGLSAGLHALVGGWAVVAAGFAWFFLRTKVSPLRAPNEVRSGEGPGVRAVSPPRLTSMLPGLVGGFLLSLPGLLPAIALSWNIDVETIRHANVIYVFERLRHHLDVFQFRFDFLYRFAFLTAFYLVLCWQLNRVVGMQNQKEQTTGAIAENEYPALRILQCFVAGSLTIALMGILVDLTSLFHRTLAAGLLRFYWFRLADIAVPLGTAVIACCWIRQKLVAKSIWGKLGLAVAVVLAGIHFEGSIPQRVNPEPARGDKNMIAASLAPKNDQPSPSRSDRMKNLAAWQDACRWVSENTPADARFFTPRLSQTFKWYARRAEVATWKDVPQDAAVLVAWWNRIQDLFATGSPQPEFRWRENVVEMKPEQLKTLAKKYNANYIIAPVGGSLSDWDTIYKNEGYVIYRVGER